MLAIFSGGCVGPVQGLYPPKGDDPGRIVYVVNHGWHTGIVVQRQEVPENIWPVTRDFPNARYLEVGWGDEGFYQAQEITSGLALKAIFWPTPSVLHVVAFDPPVERYFSQSDVVAVRLTDQGFRKMLQFIGATHARTENGAAIRLGPGLYGKSFFYRAQGSYWLMKTCNTWTAEALRAGGAPITPFYALTAGNVTYQTKKFGTAVRTK